VRVAALDVGTNTLTFLVAEAASGGGLRAVHDEAIIVRLGEGVDRTGELSAAAMERALAALEACARRAAALGATRVGAVGTQALREARNGGDFLARARAVLGVDVEVIDGAREATLSWRATASAFPIVPGARRTVLDIGGGSTELLVGSATPERLASVRIGSVRLTERHSMHDPPTDDERAAMTAAIDRALDEAPAPEGELVGIAGTVTTVCAVHLQMPTYDGARVHGTRMTRAEVQAVIERLARLPLAERRMTTGLDPKRADVIIAGATILARVMARAPSDHVLVSDRGVRWGLAEELAAPQ
jgi:exopolyphosphatase/guanosine-5'-triphosphate,3'-diphosphate pyrophosphatase